MPVVMHVDERSWLDSLSACLFWDADRFSLDPAIHAQWIIERVLERGTWQDWLLLRDHYGRNFLAGIAERLRVDPKVKNFLRIYLEQ